MLALPLTVPRLLAIMPKAEHVVSAWIGALEQAMAAYAINTEARAAMFLANIAHESRELTALEENLHYSADGLMRVFGRHFTDRAQAERYAAAGPEAIASHVYANRLGNGPEETGDGWRYRGRGPIGVTFRANYLACSSAICGDPDTLLEHPEFLADPEFGAAAAAWYWELHQCNAYADRGDFDGVCDEVNQGRKTIAVGDSIGYASRLDYYTRAKAALA